MKKIPFKQKGAILILAAFIIALAATVYILKAYEPAQLRLEQDKKTYLALNEAKQALIAWSVGHQHTPGQMPWPDRHLDVGIYDGSSDCVTTVFQYGYLLGQLPSIPDTSPCLDSNTGLNVYAGLSTYSGIGQDFRDGQGNRLWYAVSRNLVRDHAMSANPIINPSIVSTPTYPWLQVLNRNGSLISNQVAAVIIAPGAALNGQNRAGAADASQYLDRFQIGAAVFNNRGYATADEDFIVGDDGRNVSPNDPTFVQPYNFNDKLVYITIGELMAALEKRVGEEVRSNLKAYAKTHAGDYPFAAALGGVGSTRKYRCISNSLLGSLPVDNPSDTCTYASTATSVNSACNFQDITRVEFRKNTPGGFTTSSAACTNAGTTCRCTGDGSCTAGTLVFLCDAAGNCSANEAGRVRFIGAGIDTSNSPICSLGALAGCPQSRTITCNNPSSLVTMGYSCAESISTLPAWFSANRWQDSVIYELKRVTDPLTITVGNKFTRSAVITSGAAILPQIRPSCNVSNYLDDAVNVSTDSVYEPTSRPRSNNYNDQTFVVEP